VNWADAALRGKGWQDRQREPAKISRGVILSVSEREVAWRNIGVLLGRVDAAQPTSIEGSKRRET
jgi:hypothetical protein